MSSQLERIHSILQAKLTESKTPEIVNPVIKKNAAPSPCKRCQQMEKVTTVSSEAQTEIVNQYFEGISTLESEVPIIFYNTLLNDTNFQHKMATTINEELTAPDPTVSGNSCNIMK